MSATLHELFGGAITMDLPSDIKDASDIRQVPDTQEVFLSPRSDASFVLEILERVDVSDDEEAAKFHFDSLAHDNSASSQSILEVTVPSGPQTLSPPATPYPTILFGEQRVQKFNRTSSDRVRILLALYRIETKGIDVVLTANIPYTVGEGQQKDEENWKNSKGIFDVAANSLKIMDFGLFA